MNYKCCRLWATSTINTPLTSLSFGALTGNGLGIRVVGGKEVPGSNGDIGAYVAKVLPGGAAEQTGKILEGKLFHLIKSLIVKIK